MNGQFSPSEEGGRPHLVILFLFRTSHPHHLEVKEEGCGDPLQPQSSSAKTMAYVSLCNMKGKQFDFGVDSQREPLDRHFPPLFVELH